MTAKEKLEEIANRSEEKLAVKYGCNANDVKTALCKDIGTHYGDFEIRDEKLLITSDKTYEYESAEALLADWLPTLFESHVAGDSAWSDEVEFIYTAILKKHPIGILPYPGKKATRWMATYDLPKNDGSGKTKQISLGTYATITDAMCARVDFNVKGLEYIINGIPNR